MVVSRLPECNADLSAALEGFEPAGPVDIALLKGELARKRLELVRLATLVVRVEENGCAKPGVAVELSAEAADRELESRSNLTNSTGEAVFENLSAGRYTASLATGKFLTIDLVPGDRKTEVLAIKDTDGE